MNLKNDKMKKAILALVLCAAGLSVTAGVVGLPTERLELPVVNGEYLVCIWDEAEQVWVQDFETYDLSRSYRFELPSLGKWYWFGLWDVDAGEYVYEKWIGHFPTTSAE